ncbi:hypothetical protein [Acidovorax sp. Leaf78]|uniref:hypothetical protein n=1 Tax=Acidovorax sp. Leaf78 TaxID=1736237 RepID=UPI0012E2B342|nr:hypothetical protein [Acidovorax sp. Leaf78]
MKLSILLLLGASCISSFAQTISPINGRQLAEWSNGDVNRRKQFDSYVLGTYRALLSVRRVCPPTGRTDIANESAALLAVRMGVEEGLFDNDGPASEAVSDALAFWYPCTPRK